MIMMRLSSFTIVNSNTNLLINILDVKLDLYTFMVNHIYVYKWRIGIDSWKVEYYYKWIKEGQYVPICLN